MKTIFQQFIKKWGSENKIIIKIIERDWSNA